MARYPAAVRARVVRQLRAAVESGLTLAAISQGCNIGTTLLGRWCREEGISFQRPAPPDKLCADCGQPVSDNARRQGGTRCRACARAANKREWSGRILACSAETRARRKGAA